MLSLPLKIYLACVVVAIVAVCWYEHDQIDRYRPSAALFDNVVSISGVLERDTGKQGGSRPVLSGHLIACGVSFLGVSTSCHDVLPTIVPGVAVSAQAALIPTWSGDVWVIRSLATQDGLHYESDTRLLLAEWEEKSKQLPFWTSLMLVALAGIPIFFHFAIRLQK